MPATEAPLLEHERDVREPRSVSSYKCEDCGRGRSRDNLVQLHFHRGPYFDHWRRRCIAALGAVLPDE